MVYSSNEYLESYQVGGDPVETELVILYRHLLTKPAQEVDALTEKAFGFSIREQEEKAKAEAVVSLEHGPQQGYAKKIPVHNSF